MPSKPASHNPCPQAPKAPRLSAAKRGYGRTWQRLSAMVLARDPICVRCRQEPSAHADHKIPKPKGDDSIENLQGLCQRCHAIKTAREDGSFGVVRWNRYVVAGPPGAGKSTLVASRKRPGSLVWDQDQVLAQLLGLPVEELDVSADLVGSLVEMREALVRSLSRKSLPRDVWVIVSTLSTARHIAERLDAELIVLNTPADVCLARVSQRGPVYPSTQEAIQQWFTSA